MMEPQMNSQTESQEQKQPVLHINDEHEFFYVPFPGCTHRGIVRGRLRIIEKKGKKIYVAEQCGSGELLFVKQENSTFPYALPHALSEIGFFYVENPSAPSEQISYYVYEMYDGNLAELFESDSRLSRWLEERLRGKSKEEKKQECEKLVASVFLKLMFTVRSLYVCEEGISNFDIKAINVVYKIENDRLRIKMIDFNETSKKNYRHSDFNRFRGVEASLTWLAPVLPYVSLHRDDTNAITRRTAQYCDIYSMGVMLYWLYSKGDSIWRRPWNDVKHWYKPVEENNPQSPKYFQAVFKKDFQTLYYGTPWRDKSKLKDIAPSALVWAGEPERVAPLIERMLSLPEEDAPGRKETCDSIIREYCEILCDGGCLPDDVEIPRRYLPPQAVLPKVLDVVLTLTVQMFCDDDPSEPPSTFEEYRCLRIREGCVVNVPLVIYRINAGGGGFREELNDMLFLYCREGRIYYRSTAGLMAQKLRYSGAVFGELTPRTVLRFSVLEDGRETFRLSVCQREGVAI